MLEAIHRDRLRRRVHAMRREPLRAHFEVGLAPDPSSPNADASPLDRGAAVHHDREPPAGGDLGGLPAHDAELQPQAAGTDGDGLARVGHHQLGRRKMSTMSNGPVASTASSESERRDAQDARALGLTGTHSNPLWTR